MKYVIIPYDEQGDPNHEYEIEFEMDYQDMIDWEQEQYERDEREYWKTWK